MNRALTLRTGQCHVQLYMKPLLQRIEGGEIDPKRIITRTLPLDGAGRGRRTTWKADLLRKRRLMVYGRFFGGHPRQLHPRADS